LAKREPVSATRWLRCSRRLKSAIELGPMSTVLEGELDSLLEVAREMHEVCFTQGYPRVVTSIRIDDRRDKDVSMQYKTQTVEAKVGKQ